MRKLLLLLVLNGLFMQTIQASELQFERELSNKDYSQPVEASQNLPKPELVFEYNFVYKPRTRIHHRIINGGTGLEQFRAVPETEYYKGN